MEKEQKTICFLLFIAIHIILYPIYKFYRWKRDVELAAQHPFSVIHVQWIVPPLSNSIN